MSNSPENEAAESLLCTLQRDLSLFQSILDNTPEAIHIKDRQGTYILANSAAARICGLSPREMVGKTDLELWTPETASLFKEQDQQVMTSGKTMRFEETLPTRDGNTSILAIKTPYYKNEQIAGVIAFMHAAAQPEETRKALVKTSRMLQGIIQNLPAALVASDLQGRVTLWNPAAEELFGWQAEEVLGQFDPGIPPEEVEAFRRTFAEGENQKVYQEMEARRMRKDGSHCIVRLSALPLYNAEDEITGRVAILLDVTSQKEAAAAMLRREARFHSLFEEAPIVILEEDFSQPKRYIDGLAGKDAGDLGSFFTQHPEEVDACLKGIRISAANAAGRKFFQTHFPAGVPEYIEGAYLTAETRQIILEEVITFYQGESIYSGQSVDYLPDGEYVAWGVEAFLMPGHEQDWGRVRVSLQDITDRRRTEKALRDSEERFRSLFEESPLVMYEEDFSSVHDHIESLRLAGVSDFNQYFHENPQEVRRCAGMVKILASNRAARQTAVAEKNEAHREGLNNILITDVSWNSFYEMLVAFCEGKNVYRGETSDDLPDGEAIYWSVQVSIVPGSEGDWGRVFVSLIDITDRKRFEMSLQQSRQELRDLFDAIPLPTYTWQNKGGHFILVDYNTTAHQTMRGRAKEMLGKTAEENYSIRCPQVPGDIARCYAAKGTLREEREYLSISTRQHLFLSFSYAYVAPDLVLMHTEDITARRAMETALKASEGRYRSLFEHVPVPVFIMDFSAIKTRLDEIHSRGVEDMRAWLLRHPDEVIQLTDRLRIVDSNKTAVDIFKVNPQSTNIMFSSLISSPGTGKFANEMADLYEGKASFQGENFLLSLDGNMFYCQYYASIMPGYESSWGRGVFSLVDLTDRRQMEEALRESEAKFSSIFYNSPIPISLTRRDDGMFLDANQAFLEYRSLTRQELEGKTTRELELISHEDRQLLLDLVARQGHIQNLDLKTKTKNGEERIVSYSLMPIQLNGVECFMTVSSDVTERRRAETMIKASLAEKEALLKEVNHRVKNNLQVLISLIDLQSHLETSDHDAALFIELQERVRSMAMVHERLYQSPNLASIDFAAYLKDLSESLVDTYAVNPNVVVEMQVEDLWLGVDTAIPCGLILHELVSNSLKYAFPSGMKETPRILIRFYRLDSQFVLEVCDNGIGLPESVGWSNPTSLGLQLVHILSTHQLGGSLDVSREAGTFFRLVFPERV